jgi:hypothetical protein
MSPEYPDLASVRATWPARKPAYLVWFNHTRDYLYSLSELQSTHHLTQLQSFDDATVYQIDQ